MDRPNLETQFDQIQLSVSRVRAIRYIRQPNDSSCYFTKLTVASVIFSSHKLILNFRYHSIYCHKIQNNSYTKKHYFQLHHWTVQCTCISQKTASDFAFQPNWGPTVLKIPYLKERQIEIF